MNKLVPIVFVFLVLVATALDCSELPIDPYDQYKRLPEEWGPLDGLEPDGCN